MAAWVRLPPVETVNVLAIEVEPGLAGATSSTFAFGTARFTVATDAGSVMLLVPPDTAFVAAMLAHEPAFAVSKTSSPRNRLFPFRLADWAVFLSAVKVVIPATSMTAPVA